MDQLEFALVNGGNKDILITSLECGFEHASKSGWSYPAQQLTINEGDSLLLQAGRSFHCKVRFPEAFTSTFAMQGRPEGKSGKQLYFFPLAVELAWVEPTGKARSRRALVYYYGFDERGSLRSRAPMGEKTNDLYVTETQPAAPPDASRARLE
jgi:hypothetical protein